MSNDVERRVDPNGSPYYWLRGVEKETAEGTDAHEVIINGNISLSPILIEGARNEDVEKLRRFMAD
jgi:broad specificity polyphosphatase/5'/3'-nucleotidase SurE